MILYTNPVCFIYVFDQALLINDLIKDEEKYTIPIKERGKPNDQLEKFRRT